MLFWVFHLLFLDCEHNSHFYITIMHIEKLKFIKLYVLLNAFVMNVAMAEKFDNSYLLQGYEDYKISPESIYKNPKSATFSGYVNGIATVLVAENEICVGSDADINQAYDAVGDLLNKKVTSDFTPAMIVTEALITTYPCAG